MDNIARARRHRKTRLTLKGTAKRPRVSVYRSQAQVALQLIDDVTGTTLAAASGGPKEAGQKLAEAAQAKGITKAVFDRSGYKYHGRVKAVAEAVRAAGLID